MAGKDMTTIATKMMKAFQQQWDDQVAKKQEAVKEMTETARTKMNERKEEAIKQFKQANTDMLEKMKKHQDGLKDQVSTEIKKLSSFQWRKRPTKTDENSQIETPTRAASR